MVYVQFEYVYKNRKIFIEGQLDQKTFHYVTLLQKVNRRLYLDRIVGFLTQFINYENQELGSVLAVLLSIIITEAVAHFMFNNGCQGGFANFTLIGLILYTFVAHILFHRQYRIYLLGVLEVLLSIGVGVINRYQINDYHITGCFLALNTTCMLIGIVKKLMEEELENKIFAIFQFQSNLLIGVFFIFKFIQFYLPYLRNQPLNSFNLIPVILCVTLINTLKIWTLFDFNPVYLIGFLISVQNEEMQQLEKLYLFDSIFLMGQELHIKTSKSQDHKLTLGKEMESLAPEKNQKLGVLERKTSLPSNVMVDNDSIIESVNEMISREFSQETTEKKPISPYTNIIWIAFGLNLIYAITLITLIVLEKYSDSQLYLMSLGTFKLTLIILYCESQSVMMAQSQRQGYYYVLYVIHDVWMIMHLGVMYWYYDWFSYGNEYCNFSLVIHTFVPFLTRIIYRSLSEQTIQHQSNASMVHFFLCWIFLLAIRQTIVITFSKLSSPLIYIVIDTFLMIYFLVAFLTTGKTQFYKWVLQEFKKMRKMRKYKLYVMESLRNWRYDITELNQSFFLINEIFLFLGYNQFRKLHLDNACEYQIEYFIVCGSAFVVHLLQCYNNYYTQVELQQQSKPKYSPYLNYVILMVSSGIYVSFAFFANISDNPQSIASHRRYGLLTSGLCIFLTFTNIFGHYSYETVQQFRHASKPINLVISYFIFYYPFITVFTVFFFNYNLETQYIFRFAIAGFVYLTIASVTMGILVHAILNLTQKSKRTLFVIKALTEEFNKINMKEDPQFISMLENLFDLMDGDTNKLLQQLKTQKISKIIFHDDLNLPYDYSIVEPEKKQNDFIKVFADIIQRHSDEAKNHSKNLIFLSFKNIESKKPYTKKHFFKNQLFQETLKTRILALNMKKGKVENKNHTEIKRLIEAVNGVRSNDDSKMKRLIQNSQEFKDILKNEEKLGETMHRFFHFLSDPEDSFDFEMFSLLNSLLKKKNGEDLKYEFNRFSFDGQSINQEGFRDFIVHMIKNENQPTSQRFEIDSASKIWSSFMESYLFCFMTKGNDIFKYYMRRKNVEMAEGSRKVWESVNNQEKAKEMRDFRQKYNLRKQKVLGKKAMNSGNKREKSASMLGLFKSHSENIASLQENNQDQKLPQHDYKKQIQGKKHILFMTPDQIYKMLIQKLVETLKEYQKTQNQNFKLQQIKLGLSNIISILTKLFDFSYLYMYGSIYAIYAYAKQDFSNNKYVLSFLNYHIVFAVALLGVLAYVGLIIFHKKQFGNGSLGVDENQRAISFTSLKFYTTFLLFLMGSSFANVFIMASLNSYICEQQSQTLWNFPQNQCYTTAHMVEMFGSLLILLTYYPLASLIFPFSSAIDRTLQIKYKAEYEIVYLQSKFLVNGINVIFNQMNFHTEELIKSVTNTIVCIILAAIFHKLRPCSVQFINKIELKIYIALAIINGGGILCYFLDLQITLIVSLIVLLIYFIYLICTSVKISNAQIKEITNESNNLVNQRFKKQQIFKIRLKKCHQDNQIADTDLNLIKSKSQYLYEDISQKDKAQSQIKNFSNGQNVFKHAQVSNGRPSKIKRKNLSNILTIKMQKKDMLSAGRSKIIGIKEEPVQMIPATKKSVERQ